MTLKTIRDPTLPMVPPEEERDNFDRVTRFRKGTITVLQDVIEGIYDDLSLLDPRVQKGVDSTDDLIVDLAAKGLVLKDIQATPHYWRVTISTVGAIVTTDLGTVKP